LKSVFKFFRKNEKTNGNYGFNLDVGNGTVASKLFIKKAASMTPKWSWPTEKLKNLKPIFISIAKVPRVPMVEKVAVAAVVINPNF
jgi:hypothetical protein